MQPVHGAKNTFLRLLPVQERLVPPLPSGDGQASVEEGNPDGLPLLSLPVLSLSENP